MERISLLRAALSKYCEEGEEIVHEGACVKENGTGSDKKTEEKAKH